MIKYKNIELYAKERAGANWRESQKISDAIKS